MGEIKFFEGTCGIRFDCKCGSKACCALCKCYYCGVKEKGIMDTLPIAECLELSQKIYNKFWDIKK
jgi:hypothetical protein